MKTVRLVPILFIVSIGFACHNKTHREENKEITFIYIDSLSNENIIIQNKDKHRFLKLETTENCLVAKVEKMEFDEDKMFIRDSNQKIFVFDKNGKFLNTIGQIGQGPDELYCIFNFYLDKKNKRICVTDVLKSVLFSYSYNGDLLEKKMVNRDIFKDFSQLFLVEKNTLLLKRDNFPGSNYNFSLVSGNNYDNVDNCIPYLFIGEKDQGEGCLIVAQSGNETYISALISDTIYRYDAKTKHIVPDMVFKGKYRPMTKRDVEGKRLGIALDALLTAREKKLSYGISDLVMTKKYLNFVSQNPSSVDRMIWNRETKKGYTFKTFDSESMLTNFFSYVIAATDDAFVCAIPAEQLIHANWEENESAQKAAENTLEDDNPIIAFYYFE